MISIRNLTRNYGQVVAVNNISAEIEQGRIVGLLGHNGAGKTTVMKVLTGFLEPTSGTVTIDGIDVTEHRTAAQRKIGYLPERAPLYPEMLVQEYLLLMAEFRGVPSSQRHSAVRGAAESAGLTQHLVSPISTLSKGFRQRVGIAQAIVHDPDVLVLDEPTNGLDPMQIEAIRDLIRGLGERTTIILSTHILQEIEAVCDRAIVMIQGEIAADAALDELLSSNVVRVSVSGAEQSSIENTLSGIAGVHGVHSIGDSNGYKDFAVQVAEGAQPIPNIVSTGTHAGWSFGGVAPEHRTLEAVFKELQQDHIARHGEV